MKPTRAKTVEVKLSQLLPNPFQTEIYGARWKNEEVMDRLRDSIKKRGLWGNEGKGWWRARPAPKQKDKYELAFGHHRYAVAVELFGPGYRVPVEVVELSDAEMLEELSRENDSRRGREETAGENTAKANLAKIAAAQKILHKFPALCSHPIKTDRASLRNRLHSDRIRRAELRNIGVPLKCQSGVHTASCIASRLGWTKAKTVNWLSIAREDSISEAVVEKELPVAKAKQIITQLNQLPKKQRRQAAKREVRHAIRRKKVAEVLSKKTDPTEWDGVVAHDEEKQKARKRAATLKKAMKAASTDFSEFIHEISERIRRVWVKQVYRADTGTRTVYNEFGEKMKAIADNADNLDEFDHKMLMGALDDLARQIEQWKQKFSGKSAGLKGAKDEKNTKTITIH